MQFKGIWLQFCKSDESPLKRGVVVICIPANGLAAALNAFYPLASDNSFHFLLLLPDFVLMLFSNASLSKSFTFHEENMHEHL